MRRAAVAVALLLALLAGCGSGDDGGEGPTEPADEEGGAGDAAPPPVGDRAGGGVPPPPEPTPAEACDGDAVLCVDGGAGGGSGDGTADAPFGTVADAVAAAGAGTTIQVAAGTYDGAVALEEADDLTILGGFPAGGDFSERDAAAHETVLQGTSDASVVAIVGSTGVRLEGLRITGGGGTTDGSSWSGGGVHVDSGSSDVAIVGNRIDGNAVDQGDDPTATLGGGITSDGTGVSIVANVIEGNRAGRGSGIAASGETTIDRNTVRDNVSVGDHGGGLFLHGDVTVTGNRVEGNEVGVDYSWGGGVIVYGDDTAAHLEGNVVRGNLAVTAGSGVFVDDGADATLVDETYVANECAADGGSGLFVDSGGETPTVVEATNVTIAGHDCTANLGGNGILAEVSEEGDPPPEVTVSRAILWGNGGLDAFSAGADLTVTGSVTEEGVEGDGNTSDDPLFVDPEGGDYGLEEGSPAAGSGSSGGS